MTSSQAKRDTQIIDGRQLALQKEAELAKSVELLHQAQAPCRLVVLRLQPDHSADVYNRRLKSGCKKTGIDFELIDRPDITDTAGAIALIEDYNQNDDVSGIILQMPVPPGVDAPLAQASIARDKDVERVSPTNIGLVVYKALGRAPCTAQSAFELAQSTGQNFEGAQAVIVGASIIVGKPLALLCTQHNATVTICHRYTKDLARHTKEADFLFVAAGKAHLITGEMIKPGAVVVDVGINMINIETKEGPSQRLVGDVDFDSAQGQAGWITPVPGGVGPMTISIVLENVVKSAQALAKP